MATAQLSGRAFPLLCWPLRHLGRPGGCLRLACTAYQEGPLAPFGPRLGVSMMRAARPPSPPRVVGRGLLCCCVVLCCVVLLGLLS